MEHVFVDKYIIYEGFINTPSSIMRVRVENYLYYLQYRIISREELSQRDQWEDGIDKEILESLMDLREYLETRIQTLNDELEKLQALYKIVDEVIISRSFQGAESLLKEQPSEIRSSDSVASTIEPVTSTIEPVERVPLMTNRGVLLAEALIQPQNVRIIPAKDMNFNVNTTPFQSFFVSRILESMKEKDNEAVKKGEILSEMALTFEIRSDDDIIQEISVNNYGDAQRLREIRNSCRWTLEKMFERKEQE
jgi:hypothetical protein